MCFKNGVFNFDKKKLRPFAPYPVFLNAFPVTYDPEAKCPHWLEFLYQILKPEDISLLQEIMGYCSLPAMPFHKIFWFYGVGRNGKDRVIITLQTMLGKENCVQLPLSDFRESRRFSLCQLYGKLLNVSSEPQSKYPIQTNTLKKISGETTVYAELKNKNKRFEFVNIAKPIIVGNYFPRVEDNTIAFWDRVTVLEFPRSFTGKDRITNIERGWLENPDEKSGILNWMLEGLFRLQENREFTRSKSTEETKIEFMRVSDPFNAWLSDCCVFSVSERITREDAYQSYKDYSSEIGTAPDTRNSFYAKIRRTPKIRDYNTRSKNGFERGFQGIKLKENDSSLVADISDVAGFYQNTLLETNKNIKRGKTPKKTANSENSDTEEEKEELSD